MEVFGKEISTMYASNFVTAHQVGGSWKTQVVSARAFEEKATEGSVGVIELTLPAGVRPVQVDSGKEPSLVASTVL